MRTFLLFSWCLLYCCVSQATELVFYNWDEYLSDEVVARFEQETGVKVRQVYFDNDEDRDEVLMTGVSSDFDLVLIDNVAVNILSQNNTLMALPEAHYQPVSERWRARCGRYGQPYSWGTLGIAYRTDKVASAPTSWRDLLEPVPALRGHIGWLADYVDTFIPMLKVDGLSVNTVERRDLERAYQRLKQLNPHIVSYGYLLSELVRDNQSPIHMALAYSGDHYTLNDVVQRTDLWGFVTPQEGSSIWVDCIAIVAGSKRRAEALAFLMFLNRPDIAALNSSQIWSATPVEQALPLLDTELLGDTSVYPDAKTLNGSEFHENIDAQNIALRARTLRALIKHHAAQ